MAAASEQFELPFQWDDGRFISPFVSTGDSAVVELVRVLEEHQLTGGGNTMVDLGCGDGKVLLGAASKLPSLRCIGFDLDEELVERANSKGASLPNAGFQTLDIVDAPLSAFGQPSVVFMYLLPEALEALRPKIEELFRAPSTKLLVSNMWPVEYLKDSLVGRRDTLNVYDPKVIPK